MIVHDEISQNRGEFLARQRIFRTYIFQTGDQNLGVLRHLHPGFLGNPMGGFTHYVRIDRAFLRIDNECRHFFDLIIIQEIASIVLHVFLKKVGNHLVNDHCLLRSTYHTVVKRLRHHQVIASTFHISRRFNIARSIARSNTEGGFAAAVGGFHHTGTAGSQNQRHFRMVHQRHGGLY